MRNIYDLFNNKTCKNIYYKGFFQNVIPWYRHDGVE